MDIDVFPAEEQDTVQRVLRTALAAAGPLDDDARRFIATYARITGRPQPTADPAPIAAHEVRIRGAHPRKRLLQLAAIAALLRRPPSAASVAFLQALARQLGTHDPVLGVIDALARGRVVRARLLAMRRGMRALVKEAHASEGLPGVLRFLAAMWFKAPVNRDKLADYKRLSLLPEGTLGREYWKHMVEVGFNFPGEPAGIPDMLAYHDITHVLAGHPTTPLGEIQQGSFQAGSRREDGFFFVQFVILQFHHGVRLTPATPGQVGFFDPELLLWALHRGASLAFDVTHRWDFWPLMALPLDEARRRCGLLPHLQPLQHLQKA